MKKRALITGITGQDGAYLAKFLLSKNYDVYGMLPRRVNQSYSNLDFLQITSKIKYVSGDITDLCSVQNCVKSVRPTELYNLAAMSFVGSSWQQPVYTAEVNGIGVLNILESVRNHAPECRVYQASTSEMYGNNWNEDLTQNEETPFRPRSPYGSAKLFAHHTMINYRESYGIYAACGILFNHESPIRGKEFVTRKITDGVARVKKGIDKRIELGNLDARRDWGFAGDYVKAMWMMLQEPAGKSNEYVIATGETWSIREFLDRAFSAVGINSWEDYVYINPDFIRPAEVPHLKGDPTKANTKLGWKPETSFDTLVADMVRADMIRYEGQMQGDQSRYLLNT